MKIRVLTVLSGLVLFVALQVVGFETHLSYFADITELTTSCFPQGVKLESIPVEGFEWPDAHESPLFGTIPLGDEDHPMLIDAVDGEFNLYVDVDRAGEFERIDWDQILLDGSLLTSVPFEIQYANEQTASYQAFLIWSQFMPTVMTYCRSAYRSGEIVLGDNVYRVVIVDEDSDGRYDDLTVGTLFIDADRDGELLLTSDSHEIFSLAEPFNLGGVVYEVAAVSKDGSWIDLLR